MFPHWLTFSLVLSLSLFSSGCGYVHVGALPAPRTTIIGDEKLMRENTDLKTEKKMLQQELALTRAQGTALRSALENRAADGDTSKRLVDKLNETTRELISLREGYAQLQAAKNQAVATAADASAIKERLGATEERLAASLRIYTELQEEVTRLRTDVDHTRAENLALGEKVKTMTAQNEEAQAALAQLNTDLLTQKDARLRAEQDAETLRTELKTAAPDSTVLAQQRTGTAADARSLVAEHALETKGLKQQLVDLRGKVDALSAERTALQQKIASSDNERPTPEASANLEAKLASAANSERNLRNENELLLGQLTLMRNRAAGAAGGETIESQLKDAQAQVTALTSENARLTTRLAKPTALTEVMAPPVTVVSGNLTLTPKVSGVNASFVASVPSNKSPLPAESDPNADLTHIVGAGDTLARISNQYYGTPSRWTEILNANREVLGENNNLIVGRTLRIP
jgi:nucleoid-associated protein YgaU